MSVVNSSFWLSIVASGRTLESVAAEFYASDEFYASVGSSHQAELDRYDAVIFFETAACGGHGFESENRFRTESQQQAIDLDARLREQWRPHPHFTLIPHTASFFQKMTVGHGVLATLVGELAEATA